MKYACIFLPVYLLLPFFVFAQGSSCGSPYTLILDSVCRTYAISPSTSNSAICSYGNLHVTYFSFTTNSSAECVLLNITEPNGQPCEAALYAGGSCGGGNLEAPSSICFPDGKGIWAPALYVDGVIVSPKVLQPSTTYIVRVQTTSTSGNITICGQAYSPPNDDCNGSTYIGATPMTDNNACHNAGPGVVAIDLAAGTLENTAFYKYTMSASPSIFTVDNIDCDNGNESPDGSSNIGLQVGIFVGNCSALTRIDRFTANNSSGTMNRMITYPAGTNIYVAIDGTSGSNCQYTLSATNSVPLPVYIKYFTGWKTSTSNMLKWVSLQELDNDHYEIQRSEDGQNFLTIGKINGERFSHSEKTYNFEDKNPPMKCYYRLKQVDIDEHERIYKTISMIRTDIPYIELGFQNPITENLLLSFQTNFKGPADFKIVSMNGAVFVHKTINCDKGDNTLFTNLSSLPAGKYALSIEGGNTRAAKTFVKTHSVIF